VCSLMDASFGAGVRGRSSFIIIIQVPAMMSYIQLFVWSSGIQANDMSSMVDVRSLVIVSCVFCHSSKFMRSSGRVGHPHIRVVLAGCECCCHQCDQTRQGPLAFKVMNTQAHQNTHYPFLDPF